MDGLRSVWRRGGELVFGDSSRLPERDEHMAVADSLMSELDFHIRELSRIFQQREREKQRSRTGVDYTWLIAAPPRTYEIPQLERLELEELCLKLDVGECSRVISLFRDAISNEPRPEDLVRIMRSCIIQTLEQRPQVRSTSILFADWVTRRASSLANLKLKTPARVEPTRHSLDDIEMQAGGESRTTRAFSMPSFSVTSSEREVKICRGDNDTGTSYPDTGTAYPV